MELTTRGRYAVMSMAELARHKGSDALALSVVAERQRLSLDYLEQIFAKLRRADLVQSTRGRTGGYKLSRPASEINIADIMVAVEEETRMTRCLNGESGGCLGEERCLTHNLWKALANTLWRFLRGISLQDVLEGNSILAPSPVGQVQQRPAPAISKCKPKRFQALMGGTRHRSYLDMNATTPLRPEAREAFACARRSGQPFLYSHGRTPRPLVN